MRVLPPWENALDPAAQRCAELLADRSFPDLSDTLVLLPGIHAAPALRARIREVSGRAALIGPVCHTLGTLAGTTAPARRGGEQRARLMLLDALRGHPALTGDTDPWTLVEALITLFAELGDQCGGLPGDADALATTLRSAYGDRAPERPLRREATLVATLWQAWCERGGQDAGFGDGAAALAALASWRERGGNTLIGAGLDRMPRIIAPWLAGGVTEGWATLYHAGPAVALPAPFRAPDTGPVAPPDALNALADAALGTATDPLAVRAAALGEAWPQPPSVDAFAVAAADDAEHEARTVDVQLRQWWLIGMRRIALVTEDRKLARRVRALLARAGLLLDDSAGWALSTTSAAAALERWLEAVEEDFRASPLLDLLKSPFCHLDDDHEAQLASAWQFEEGIVRHEQVGRGTGRYRHAIRRRAARLPDEWGEALAGRLERMLDRVEHAAAPLLRHVQNPNRAFPASECLAALHESLTRLGLHQGFAGDAAGQRVLEELAGMARAADGDAPALNWREWRTWLGRTLERAVFREPVRGGIALLSLADCATGEYDAVLVAGADAEHMPGRAHAHPFFNDGVREQLGLETWPEQRALQALRFRRALALAPHRVVTWARERAQAERLPSPWLAALQAVYALAWSDAVPAPDALALARDPATLVTRADAPLPAVSKRPRPALDRLPLRWSAGAHQNMIDCPYRWFAAHRLQLDAPDPLREALSKQDFGSLVHRCLQAFHTDVAGLPGPFGRVVDAASRDDAAALLLALGDAVLAEQAESDFIARAWLRAWRRAVPRVVDFEVERTVGGWRVEHVEHGFERRVGAITLHGRIDRVEIDGHGRRAVLDYKTGAVATIGAVAAAEHVQLASYAAGIGDVDQLYFVGLGPALKGERVALAGVPSPRYGDVDVEALIAASLARLGDIVERLAGGAQMPAWGDEKACAYCRYAGICRRETWADA